MWGLGRSTTSVSDYYQDAAVRRRIREYCGLTGEGGRSSRFLVTQTERGGPGSTWDDAPFCSPGCLDRMLAEGGELSRSHWDSQGFLFFLDLDYLNTDRPAEPFTHPIETFFKLEPTYRAVRDALRDFGLAPLEVLTGEGYHFTGHVPGAHPVFRRLATLAPAAPPWLRTQAVRAPAWSASRMDESTARAYVGYGLVLEYLAHEILRLAGEASEIPVVLGQTPVGTGANGRECVSIDLSHLADPLDIRHVRVAFSAYQKHRFRPDIYGRAVSEAVPACAAVVRNGGPLLRVLEGSRDLRKAAALAEQCSAVVPDLSDGISRLVDEYRNSPLRLFHDRFYSTVVDQAQAEADLQELLRRSLPRCVMECVERPNDLLLRPEHLQHLSRFLLSEGWEARRVAALVRNLYEADHGWKNRWIRMDPEWRAEVYVRCFAGMIATGADDAIDFNCVSTREKGMCPGGPCGHNLADDRAALLAGGAA